MIYPAECNPVQDREMVPWNGDDSTEEPDSDTEADTTPQDRAESKERRAAKIRFFQTKFDRMLEIGNRFPNCDIFVCMDERLQRGPNQDHMTHFKMAPWYLARCAPRLRVFTCYLLRMAYRTQYSPLIIRTLFGSSTRFPRLEHIQFKFDWEVEDYFSVEVDELLSPEGDDGIVDRDAVNANLPNLISMNTYPCPWHILRHPHLHFQHLYHLRLIDLDNVDTVQPSIWQMVNACPNLELLQLTWWAIITMDDWERAVVPFSQEERITVERITSLEIQLYDRMLWPILENTFFPKLRWLSITVVGHYFKDYSARMKRNIVYGVSDRDSEDSSKSESENGPGTTAGEIDSETERKKEKARRRSEGQVRKVEIGHNWPKLEYLQLYPLHAPSARFLIQSTFDVLDTLDISYRWPNEFMRSTDKRMMVFHPRKPYAWFEDENEKLRMPMIRKVVGRTTGMKHVGLLGALNRPLGVEDHPPQTSPSAITSGLKEIDVLIDKSSPEASSRGISVDLNRINPHIFMHLERITFRFNRYEAPASGEIDISYCLGLMIGLMDCWYAPKLCYIAFVAEGQNPELDLDLESEASYGMNESEDEDEDEDEKTSASESDAEDEDEDGKTNANESDAEDEGEHRDDPNSDQPKEQLQKAEDSQRSPCLKITEEQLERLVAFLESRSEAFARVEQVRLVGIKLPDMSPSAMLEEQPSAVEKLMSAVRYVEVVSD